MSLVRLLLRSLTVSALQQQPGEVDAPTMAGDKVFDSRLDPYQFDAGDTDIPAIAVYTDDDLSELVNTASNSTPFRRRHTLRIEATIGSCDTLTIDGQTGKGYLLPVTDAQLEARLDLFEQQIRWALINRADRPITAAWQSLVIRTHHVHSHATRDESGNNRLASRVMIFSVETRDDCGPNYALGQAPQQVPLDLSPFAGTWLHQMLEVLYQSPSLKPVIDVLAGNTNAAVILPLIKRIGINVDAVEPEADPNLLAQQGKTQGPDGRIEVQAMWKKPT